MFVLATNMNDLLNWSIYSELLVNRGDLALYVDPAILNNDEELQEMNRGKRGRPNTYYLNFPISEK